MPVRASSDWKDTLNIEFNAAQTTAIRAMMLTFQHLGITPIDFQIGAEGRLGARRLVTVVTFGVRVPRSDSEPERISGYCDLDRPTATDPWDVSTICIRTDAGGGFTLDRPLSSLAAGH